LGAIVKYAVVYERGDHNYAAYVPDLPGCVATGQSKAEVERRIRTAIRMHVTALEEDNEVVPEPQTWTDLVEV
jgi:predicted RNase H-like HicB family nuclease